MTAPEELAALVARLRGLMAKATPGPWERPYGSRIKGDNQWVAACDVLRRYGSQDGFVEANANAALIVEAVNALPVLLPALEALSAGGWREKIRNEVINSPETADFMAGVPIEAAHQRERWAVDHDAGKTPFDWFWLVGYLAQKAASSAVAGDVDKAKHHTVSTAAALSNWHAALTGADTRMRPGIEPPASLQQETRS